MMADTVALVRAQWPMPVCEGVTMHVWRIESKGVHCNFCDGFVPKAEYGEYIQWVSYVMTVTLPKACSPWRWN